MNISLNATLNDNIQFKKYFYQLLAPIVSLIATISDGSRGVRIARAIRQLGQPNP